MTAVRVSCRQVSVGATDTAPAGVYRVQNYSRKYDPTFLMEEEREERRVWTFRGYVTIFQES